MREKARLLRCVGPGGFARLVTMVFPHASTKLWVKCDLNVKRLAVGTKCIAGSHVQVKALQAELSVIGVDREELRWLRNLVWLLRHPDPSVPELARQALLYLTGAAEQRSASKMSDEPYRVGPNLVS
jgi:hypothetical protein